MSQPGNTAIEGLLEARFGVSSLPSNTLRAYGAALLAIAGADGVISPPERSWFDSLMRDLGGTDEHKVYWAGFDFRAANLIALLGFASRGVDADKTRMSLLHDAVRMAYADGDYARSEAQAVGWAAQVLGVTAAKVAQIEAQVDAEHTLAGSRSEVFSS